MCFIPLLNDVIIFNGSRIHLDFVIMKGYVPDVEPGQGAFPVQHTSLPPVGSEVIHNNGRKAKPLGFPTGWGLSTSKKHHGIMGKCVRFGVKLQLCSQQLCEPLLSTSASRYEKYWSDNIFAQVFSQSISKNQSRYYSKHTLQECKCCSNVKVSIGMSISVWADNVRN